MQIPARDVVTLAGAEIGERVKLRCPFGVLLGEPELIAAQKGGPHQVGIVSRRHQLRAVRVGLRQTEQPQHRFGGLGMEAGVEFVDEQRRASVERAEGGTEHHQQPPRAGTLQIQIKIDPFAVTTAMGEFDSDLLIAPFKIGWRLRELFDHAEKLVAHHSVLFRDLDFVAPVIDDPGSDITEKVDHPTVRLFLRQHCGSGDARDIDALKTVNRTEIAEHPRQPVMLVLGGRRQIQAVGPGEIRNDGVASTERAPETELAGLALEQHPAAGVREVVEPFGHERRVGRLETVMVAHAVDREIELEARRFPGALGVEPERLARHAAFGAALGVGERHHCPHRPHRTHEVALARGVGAVDHGRRDDRPAGRGRAGDQPLVRVLQGGRRERQLLEAAERQVVGDAEAEQHADLPSW